MQITLCKLFPYTFLAGVSNQLFSKKNPLENKNYANDKFHIGIWVYCSIQLYKNITYDNVKI